MDNNFFKQINPKPFERVTIFPEQIAQAVQMDDNFFLNGYPDPFKRIPNPFGADKATS